MPGAAGSGTPNIRTSVQHVFLLRAPAARAIELVRMAYRVLNRDPCVYTYWILTVLPTAYWITGLDRWGIRLLEYSLRYTSSGSELERYLGTIEAC